MDTNLLAAELVDRLMVVHHGDRQRVVKEFLDSLLEQQSMQFADVNPNLIWEPAHAIHNG